MPLSFLLVDKNKKVLELDSGGEISGNNGYLTTIDIEHHKIHEGEHYVCSDYDNDVDITGPKYWHFKSPATGRIHFIFEIISSKNGLIEFFESPTITGNGTALTCYNNDRNSTSTTTLLAYYDATASADGTKLLSFVVGSDGANPTGARGGSQQRVHEFILKANTSYLIKHTATTDNSRVSMTADFYEI